VSLTDNKLNNSRVETCLGFQVGIVVRIGMLQDFSHIEHLDGAGAQA
jgi:hypothetical protein